MSLNKKKATILFANCAGAARNENADPEGLGRFLGQKLLDQEIYGDVIAVGLSELLFSTDTSSFNSSNITESEDNFYVNNLTDFERGFNGALNLKTQRKHSYSLVNSHDYSSAEALENKWKGKHAVGKIKDQTDLGRNVHCCQGTLIYLDQDLVIENLLLRSSGIANSDTENPLKFLGTRDTEPRGAIIINRINYNNQTFNLGFLHLETNSSDSKRLGIKSELEETIGAKNRFGQLSVLNSYFKDETPTILMGDFNARPGVKEITEGISDFQQVYPENFDLEKINYSYSEASLGLPYSHLGHQILIDHAFVRNINNVGKCSLKVIDLNERLSDHNAIALTIEFSN